MELVTSGTIRNWSVNAACENCKATHVVGLADVWHAWWSDGRHRHGGPMFECTKCGSNNGIIIEDVELGYTLAEMIPPDKRAWQMKSGHNRVKAPGALLRLRQKPGSAIEVKSELPTSPASRLLDACLSVLEAQFTAPFDTVVVDFASACVDPAVGDIDVIAEVIRRLEDKEWIVEVRQEGNAPPQALRFRADIETLEHHGWLKGVVGRGSIMEPPFALGWKTFNETWHKLNLSC